MGKLPRVVLNSKDLLLFERLATFGFLTTNETAKYVFKKPRTATSDRLVKLRKAGFIDLFTFVDSPAQAIYRPHLLSLRGILDSQTLRRAHHSCRAQVWRSLFQERTTVAREIALRILVDYPHLQVDLGHQLFPNDWEGDYRNTGSKSLPQLVLKDGSELLGAFKIELGIRERLVGFAMFNGLTLNARCPIVFLCKDQKIAKAVLEKCEGVASYLKSSRHFSPPKMIALEFREVLHGNNLRSLVDELQAYKKVKMGNLVPITNEGMIFVTPCARGGFHKSPR